MILFQVRRVCLAFVGLLLAAALATPTGERPARERARSFRTDTRGLPGEFGPDATVEVDPHRIGSIRTSYSPRTDGAPDPGEVVWTWVPFEENDGRGKRAPAVLGWH